MEAGEAGEAGAVAGVAGVAGADEPAHSHCCYLAVRFGMKCCPPDVAGVGEVVVSAEVGDWGAWHRQVDQCRKYCSYLIPSPQGYCSDSMHADKAYRQAPRDPHDGGWASGACHSLA